MRTKSLFFPSKEKKVDGVSLDTSDAFSSSSFLSPRGTEKCGGEGCLLDIRHRREEMAWAEVCHRAYMCVAYTRTTAAFPRI